MDDEVDGKDCGHPLIHIGGWQMPGAGGVAAVRQRHPGNPARHNAPGAW
jgi:hypothetical protein